MDEQTAWNFFCATGRVEDYLRYSRQKQRADTPAAQNLRTDTEEEGHAPAK